MIQIKKVSLHEITEESVQPIHGGVTLLVGENGAGKTRALRSLAMSACRDREVIVMSSSPFNRFARLRRQAHVLAYGRGSSPERVLKRAISNSYERDELQLRSISRILRYCGYQPEVGFKISISSNQPTQDIRERIEELSARKERDRDDLISIIYLITSSIDRETLWMDFDGYSVNDFVRINIPRVLFWEKELKALGIISGISLFLRSHAGVVSLSAASSGEVSLIISMVFLALTRQKGSLLLIDEPENSLHPTWQREYLSTLSGVLGYETVTIVIATHSPMIVMGCEALDADASVYVMSPTLSSFEDVDLADLADQGIEAIMAEVFHIITPKNHFLSGYLVELLDRLESGDISRRQLHGAVAELSKMGLDSTQEAAVALVEKMADELGS
ncbi:AAA family ATPase [Xanthomonas sp. CFBP 7698]|uniref:AAA family ATPase n=1 Tax=unclassified Xanthomonas TaxID=2643310 RepID=UPI000EEC014C|nr:AAA family ATPase [Xanthomonas sp. CFBP 7698]RJS02677.1 hypothetical protein XnspCFBP7698_13830 [Xanthomonas sp. CFBP 7698]